MILFKFNLDIISKKLRAYFHLIVMELGEILVYLLPESDEIYGPVKCFY